VNHHIRAAFLTNEFVIENPSSGGLANYLNRITRSLQEMGHEPEVFVVRSIPGTPSVLDHRGVRVEHVDVARSLRDRLFRQIDGRFLASPWGGPSTYLASARALAAALDRRHREKPFSFVQSATAGASGYLVSRMPGRPHLVRMNSHRGLWFETDGVRSLGARLMIRMERKAVCRADIAYAPSRFVAEWTRRTWRTDVRVLRPPAFLEVRPLEGATLSLPDRYLVHFGQIGVRKGSDAVAAALRACWCEIPDLKMVWAGTPIRSGEVERYQREWGDAAHNVLWLGSVERPLLYSIVRGAAASVLPSRVDNLPNSVIESLLLRTPVIGFAGGSVDELVESGRSGELVPMGDVTALSGAMIRTWRGGVRWLGGGFETPAVLGEMEPALAAKRLLELAGFSPRPGANPVTGRGPGP
jgi:glycosyltransferase involved in cell wall biosynthesis